MVSVFAPAILPPMQLRHRHGAYGMALLVLARLARLELAAAEHQGGRPRVGEARAVAAQHDNYGGDVGALVGVILHAEQRDVDASQDLPD